MLKMNPPTERVSISKIFYDIEKKSKKFVVQMKKRKFLHANNSKYRDKFNITPLGWGCSQPTTIRIMNGPQKFPLLAFTSKQKNVRK